MQFHHDFQAEIEMQRRETAERVLQGRHRRAAERLRRSRPSHGLWHALAVSVTHRRRK